MFWVPLAMMAASMAMSMRQAQVQQQETNNALAVQASQDGLELAQRENDSQRKLASVLATQSNLFAATGINAGEGSAMAAADAAKDEADRQLSLLNVGAVTNNSLYAMKRQAAGRQASGSIAGSLVDFGTSAYGGWNRQSELERQRAAMQGQQGGGR